MSLLDALSPYKLAAEIAVFGALAAGATFGVHQFLEHERDIGRQEVQARWDKQQALDVIAARAKEAENQSRIDDAEKNGATREQTNRTLAAASGASAAGLRDALATIRSGVPTATIDSLGQSVATLSAVLTDCTGQYRGMAEIADRHSSDAQKLSDSWPK